METSNNYQRYSMNKRKIIIAGLCILTALTVGCKMEGVSPERALSLPVGSDYQGGVVAYVLQPGDAGYVAGECHGLIAAAADLNAGSSLGVPWIPGDEALFSGITDTALNTGEANTEDIVIFYNSVPDPGFYAAQCCLDFTNPDTGTGVYDDWYLPSQDELNKLYINKDAVGGFNSSFYWSSSEADLNNACAQSFGSGEQEEKDKLEDARVRPVRAF